MEFIKNIDITKLVVINNVISAVCRNENVKQMFALKSDNTYVSIYLL